MSCFNLIGHRFKTLTKTTSGSNISIQNDSARIGRSDLLTWKYQFSYDHWSQAMLSSVSTWMGDCSSVARVLLLTLDLISRPTLVAGCWLCVDAELEAIGQCRLGVHGTCGLINHWHHLLKMSSWVGYPGRSPYVIPRGSAGLKKMSMRPIYMFNLYLWNAIYSLTKC